MMIDNYKSLTLRQYDALKEIDLEQEEIDIQVEMIAILSDESVDDILNLPIPEYQKRVRKTAFLMKKPNPVINPPRTVKINGRVYRVMKDAREFTTAQYIDFKNITEDPEKVDKRLPQLMTVFLIPKDAERYNDGYDLQQVMDDAQSLSVEIVFGLSRFFFRQSKASIGNTLTYLDWVVKKMKKREKRTEIVEKMETAQSRLRMLRSLLESGDGLVG